ncbi:cyclin-D1-1-like [Quercus robur]|uniref:cyclin-D1-1-like n=1 Tax=Quercus robur TaxID=38942 RepID=UPI002163E8AF|nr:cyclin-D1-1-like [Quercus robur]
MSHSRSSTSATNLYCAEDADGVVSWEAGNDDDDDDDDTWISSNHRPSSSDDDGFDISRVFESEPHHMPRPDYLSRCRDRSIDVTARQDSINWILKVHAYYHFRPVTAFLSVNYLDRFLSSHSVSQQQPNGWPSQLLSVACLSLAAKLEEPDVPLILDLQVSDAKYVFEPKTVQRMELRVLSFLNWRLRSVTPFDFLPHFISNLPSTSKPHSFNRVFSASSDLILSTTRVIDFLGYAPSTIAAAAVLCASGEAGSSACPVVFDKRVNKEMVRSCHQLMEEYLIDTCPLARLKERRAEQAPPPSPVGVLDAAACGSCDTRSENPSSTGLVEAEAEAEAEPPIKRLRSSTPDVQNR